MLFYYYLIIQKGFNYQVLSLGDLYQPKLLFKRHRLTSERVERQVRYFSLHLICSKNQLKTMT